MLTISSQEATEAGRTVITISEALGAGNSYKYKVAANPSIPTFGQSCTSGYTNWDGSSEIAAENGKTIVVIEVDSDNKAVKVGTATVISKE